MSLAFMTTMMVLLADAESDEQRAKTVVRTAQQAYRDGQYRVALDGFREVLRLRPRPGIHYNLARCHEALNETGPALREYREYLRLAPGATDRATVQELVGALEGKLSARRVRQLAIMVEPLGASISVDGADVGPAPAYVEVSDGPHVVAIAAKGFDAEQRTVDVTGTRLPELVVQLKRETAPVVVATVTTPVPAAPPLVAATLEPRTRWATWVAGGTAIVAASTGLVLGVLANASSTELRTLLHERQFADVLVTRVGAQATGANIAWAVAGAALVAAVVLFFVEAR